MEKIHLIYFKTGQFQKYDKKIPCSFLAETIAKAAFDVKISKYFQSTTKLVHFVEDC